MEGRGLLVLTLVLWAGVPASAVTGRFVVLGDSQFNHPDVFERMTHEVALLRPDCVIQVGDMIHGYTHHEPTLRAEWERFRRQIAPLTMPFYPVPGNHDVGTPEAERVYGEVWGSDRYHYAFDAAGARHIVLDSDWRGEAGVIGPAQREWLAAELAAWAAHRPEDASGPIFVYLHRPLFHDADPAKWADIHALLRGYPVRAVFAGHTHNYSWDERDGIQYIVVNSAGAMPYHNERAGRFHGYCYVSVHDGEVSIAVLRAGAVLPADTVTQREFVARRTLMPSGGTVALTPPPGEPIAATGTLRLRNRSQGAREYRLRWQIPPDSPWRVEPETLTTTLGPGAHELVFRFAAPAAARDAAPRCTVETRAWTRAGIVPLAAEAALRAATPPGALQLDEETVYSAEWAVFFPPRADVARASGPIAIDGRLEEADWRRAPALELTAHPTRVHLAYDDANLYAAAWMAEPNPAGLRAAATGPIAMTWADDDFELFIDPGATRERFHRLFVNCAGTRFTSRPAPGGGHDLSDGVHTSAVFVGADYWAVELAIPWAEFGQGAPRSGEMWGLNAWRHRNQAAGQRRDQWSQMNDFPYEPERFGLMVFE